MMKFLLTLLFFIYNSGFSNAAILLVNNSSTLVTTYQQIDDAITAANAGDTIYVTGSSAFYNNCTITKSITLIGGGTFAQKQNAIAPLINTITVNSNLDHITIEGFDLDQISFFSKTNIHHVIIRNNRINTQLYCRQLTNSDNFLISNNLFELAQLDFWQATNLSNIIIQNNFIKGDIYGFFVNNGLISHNVFYNTTGANANAFTTAITNAIISDNIFYNRNPVENAVNCTYQNNISYNTTITYTSMGSNNLDNTDPLFVNITNGVYLPSDNLNLLSNSPGINYASDGTNVGIYGGNANTTLTGEVYNMPVIRLMNIQNSTVPQNGNVNVKVKSTRSRTN